MNDEELYNPGDVWKGVFSTRSSTGQAPASSLPTAVVMRNGVVDATPIVTITGPAGPGGNAYAFSVTIPGTYIGGDVLDMLVTASVAGNTDTDTVDQVRLSAAAGEGRYQLTINVKDSFSAANINGANVLVSGSQSAVAITDVNGNALVNLSAGTPYVSIAANGYTNYVPTAQAVNSSGQWVATGTTTLSLTMVALAASSAPFGTQTVVVVPVFNSDGSPAVGAQLSYRLVAPPANTSGAFLRTVELSALSDIHGNASFDAYTGAEYQIWLDSGPRSSFVVGQTPPAIVSGESP